MAGKNTVDRVSEIIKPYVDELSLELWDVTFKKEGTDWYLRVFIDKNGGVSIDDCVNLTHAITKPLDEADPISQSYMLEVSSPGVERELKTDKHFAEYVGSSVMMRTIRPIDSVRDFNGVMTEFNDGMITVELKDGKKVTVNKKETSFVKLDDFDINDFNKEI